VDKFSDYVKAGWALCGLPRGAKGPTYPNWQLNPVPLDAADGLDGAGLLHALSGSCALDVDDIGAARVWLGERGIDLDGLLEARDAVQIDSGARGRAKLLYRLKAPLRTFKPPGSGLELRCATLSGTSVQDALPPSLHPSGRRYAWKFAEPLLGDWSPLPAIPAALKTAWRQLIAEEPTPMPYTNGDMDIALEKLYAWIGPQDPNMDYERWYRIGAKLHHATHGAEEGLALWDSWSAKATRKRDGAPIYATANCRAHWVSFSSPKGKIVATLDNELPADADEFDVVAPAPAATTEEAMTRQTAQARKDAIATLEARVVYVLASEKYFDTQRHQLIGSDSALEHQFTSMMPRGKNGRMNPVKILKQSTTKRLVEGLGFHPGEGALFQVKGDTYANLYRNRLPAPLEPTKLEAEKIEWLFARIDDENYRTWLKQYFGHVAQHPAVKIKTAPLIWSEEQRNGKSTLLKSIPALLVGREFSIDVSYDMLNSGFNDYLQGAWHVNLVEFRAGSRGERTMINHKLKAYIADDMVALHPKGSRGYEMPNHAFVTASSNEEDAAAIDNNDKRWGIHEMKAPEYTESERQWIYHQFLLVPRSAAVLRHYFLHVDLTGFYPAGSAPMTEAKRQMAAASLPMDTELLLTMFEEKAEFFNKDVVITSDVVAYVQKRLRFVSATRIGRILAKPPFNGIVKRFKGTNGRLFRGVIIRNHSLWDAAPHDKVMAHINFEDDLIEVDLLS
jgi:hypothetical protein